MPRVARSSDIVEIHAEKALSYGIGGIVAIALGVFMWIFRGEGWLIGLCYVVFAAGIAAIGYAAYAALQIRKVKAVTLVCVYCGCKIDLVDTPSEDVTCTECHRSIPIENGMPLEVAEVRCGYCNTLNFYCKKTQFLICEKCDREIPISVAEGVEAKHIPRGYVTDDDTHTYELSLFAFEHCTEDLISCLQHMLALNRNQVKQMVEVLPTTLLTGIPRKKAEMLKAQLATHGATADMKVVS